MSGVSPGGLIRAGLVLALVTLVLAAQAVAYSSPTSLNGIASKLAGRKVMVRCLTQQESVDDLNISVYGAEAYVEGWIDRRGRWHPKNYTVFKFGHCENLLGLMAGDVRGTMLYDLTWSILALVHESGHLKGARWSGSEAKTQCWAMQHLPAALNMLGVRAPDAKRLVVWQAVQIHKFDLWPEYQEPGCQLPIP